MRRWAEGARSPGRNTGFTLFELILVVILVGILFATAAWRLLPLRGDAEAAHVATNVGTLRSALGLEVAERVVEESLRSAAALEGVNPMTLLERAPGNYKGEFESSEAQAIAPGSWYFHTPSDELRYRVRYPRYLASPAPGRRIELAWRVRSSFTDRNGDGDFDVGDDSLHGVFLEALDNPGWPLSDNADLQPPESR